MDSGFHVCGSRIPHSITNNLDSGLQLWLDSKAVDSGFHRPKLPGFRIPDSGFRIPDSGLPYMGRGIHTYTFFNLEFRVIKDKLVSPGLIQV